MKKINYIEADIEIHKQILFAIPSAEKVEMEKTITVIAAKKREIEKLRQELQQENPAEYQRILLLEKATADFRKIAQDNPFRSIQNRQINGECSLSLHNGERIECLIKACDHGGNWTVITIDGLLQRFAAGETAEKPPEDTPS